MVDSNSLRSVSSLFNSVTVARDLAHQAGLEFWAWHEHAAADGKEAILFSIQDTPIMRSMALYREEPYVEHGGNQPVTSRFLVGTPA